MGNITSLMGVKVKCVCGSDATINIKMKPTNAC